MTKTVPAAGRAVAFSGVVMLAARLLAFGSYAVISYRRAARTV
ncbi:hypothetical protein AB0Q95_01055 [Streptomyces sp. NPDC059900]